MSVGTDGRVLATRILESSNVPDFDEKVLKYYMKQRFIPALDENGTPIEGIACQRFHQRAAQPVKISTIANPHRPENEGESSSIKRTSRTSHEKTYDEVERISRMRCKDFTWEVDLMRDIVPRRPLTNELLYKTAFAMYIVRDNVSDDELRKLERRFSAAMDETVDQCRATPDAMYFQNVLIPEFRSQIGRAAN